jgi:hypothetical protein
MTDASVATPIEATTRIVLPEVYRVPVFDNQSPVDIPPDDSSSEFYGGSL